MNTAAELPGLHDLATVDPAAEAVEPETCIWCGDEHTYVLGEFESDMDCPAFPTEPEEE